MTNKVLLVVGLGNPGPGYALNRHNVGAMVVETLAARHGGTFKAHKAGALVAEVRTGVGPDAQKLILAKPTSFMNRSGGPTVNLLKFYGLTIADLIVVHDELDIPSQDVRLKQGGGHAGHNGLRDIIAASGTNDFARVRVGIGRPPGTQETADFVLQNFGTVERKELPTTLEIAADAVEAIGSDGVAKASLRFHSA